MADEDDEDLWGVSEQKGDSLVTVVFPMVECM